ncbi:oxygen-independent coproporphyrinogen III oxidase [Uliginosibacterium sp. TH139]|uniref:oxygen-independent coproporphyrinogen III oxidase n=1 Tax=Uliginosibacterium sp. TH139 TaxID=2067453 RepID=UPI000C7C0675|nr:oxygen-independent coproporphyrinogen III oxidase [Uliginosibacterium sp. TH139]PLK48412.1 oxygen-independent coproporphyrinogen III oxidase [Uliginosibacterium sp. TH139]
MLQTIQFDPDMIRRFDVPGPRYTSYPTADRFLAEFTPESQVGHLARLSTPQGTRPLSLYFHIPFCNTICYYCACNKVITKDHSRSAKYIDYLEREMAMQAALLPAPRPVAQMHWGGGTPTFLQPEEILRLMSAIRQHFTLQAEGEFSIEVDPRKVSAETVALLAREGFNRMSVGVQDFDPKVQAAVNRRQSVEETRLVIDAARAEGFRSISVDLIYGLPHQSVEGFGRTLDTVLAMQPDRLALYNYAHLPSRFMPQRRINETDLPAPDAKLQILALAIERLGAAGYVFIGMDHFARPDDELAVAQREGRLQRNFQGYSTHAECDLLAFGVSAIGKAGGAFCQNQRELDPYYAALDRGELPVMRGWALSADDELRNAVIQTLMCDFSLSFELMSSRFGVCFEEYFAAELNDLRELGAAGLLSIDAHGVQVSAAGRMLVRIIAMVFDAYLRSDREKRRYSRVI